MSFLDRIGSGDVLQHLLIFLDVEELIAFSLTCHTILDMVHDSITSQFTLLCHFFGYDCTSKTVYNLGKTNKERYYRLCELDDNIEFFRIQKVRHFKVPKEVDLKNFRNGRMLLSIERDYGEDSWPETWLDLVDINGLDKGGSYEMGDNTPLGACYSERDYVAGGCALHPDGEMVIKYHWDHRETLHLEILQPVQIGKKQYQKALGTLLDCKYHEEARLSRFTLTIPGCDTAVPSIIFGRKSMVAIYLKESDDPHRPRALILIDWRAGSILKLFDLSLPDTQTSLAVHNIRFIDSHRIACWQRSEGGFLSRILLLNLDDLSPTKIEDKHTIELISSGQADDTTTLYIARYEPLATSPYTDAITEIQHTPYMYDQGYLVSRRGVLHTGLMLELDSPTDGPPQHFWIWQGYKLPSLKPPTDSGKDPVNLQYYKKTPFSLERDCTTTLQHSRRVLRVSDHPTEELAANLGADMLIWDRREVYRSDVVNYEFHGALDTRMLEKVTSQVFGSKPSSTDVDIEHSYRSRDGAVVLPSGIRLPTDYPHSYITADVSWKGLQVDRQISYGFWDVESLVLVTTSHQHAGRDIWILDF